MKVFLIAIALCLLFALAVIWGTGIHDDASLKPWSQNK